MVGAQLVIRTPILEKIIIAEKMPPARKIQSRYRIKIGDFVLENAWKTPDRFLNTQEPVT